MSVSRNGQHPRSARNGRGKIRPGAAFYDLDGTLVDLNLVHAALFMQTNLGEWSGRIGYVLSFLARAPRLYLAERDDRRVLNAVLFESLKGVSEDRLFSLGEEYCERVLVKHLYPQAIQLLDANHTHGLRPVLVTGSPDFIVAPLARHLGIEDYAANHLTTVGGRATGRIAEPVMAGEAKAIWCEQFASEHNLDLAASWGYADSYYDMPFLAALGHPVAVNPDRRLRTAAVSRHWPIIHFDTPEAFDSAGHEFADPATDGRPAHGAT
ncbi:MAG TPA: HAD-IB family hydrolase [Candidatus Binataceae bacterium]|nr:HAD-IB family hydrolase [Candidatus Binataceae bacterium]